MWSATPDPRRPGDERVLVLAPTGCDAELTCTVLRDAGLRAEPCRDVPALCAAIEQGVGAVVLGEEALALEPATKLLALLARQPPWSDLPLIVFTRSSDAAHRLLEMLGPLANVTLLDRPVRMQTLVSAARVALRARRRQYQVRDLLVAQAEADRRKDEFLAVLGHELRNPLNAMRLALGARGRPSFVPGDDPRHHEVLERQTANLARMLDDLLDVSRIARGKLSVQRAPLDLNDVVAHAVRAAERAARAQRHALRLEPATAPLPVLGDPVRLEQVVANLLTNAIKYTPPGGAIDVRLAVDDAHAVVRVRDSGTGLAPEMLETIFEPFVQVDHSLDRAQGGLGLGLPLVRRLVELHDGAVCARSAGLGHGAEFEVRLPLAAHPPVAAPTRDASDGAARVASRADGDDAPARGVGALRVLVVEDGDDNRELLCDVLAAWGCEVVAAATGREGLEKCLAARPDVAIVDIGLPELDGYELARRVRASGVAPATRLIAMTGYGQPEERRRALEAGFDRHLVKPVDLETLERAIREYGRDEPARSEEP